LSARSALTKGSRGFISEISDRLSFVLISSRVKLGTGAVQSVRRPNEALGVCNLNELLRDCCCKECAESKGVQHLKVFEGPPQGVTTGVSVGKCLTGSVCLSLMASTTVKMA
jgi:hypothetical protein